MAVFYFIRHGQMDTSMAGKKFYKGFAYNMMPSLAASWICRAPFSDNGIIL